MGKFKVGQELITERHVGISVFEMNGITIDDVVDYPKGEVVEILEDLGNGDYRIEFWTDINTKVNGKGVTYVFDEETIEKWLTEEKEEDI